MTGIREVFSAAFGDDVTKGRRSGPNQFRTRCVFHSPDAHPSLDVDLSKNVYCCRSVNCGAAGGTLDLVVAAGYASDHSGAAKWLWARGL
jgi:hypothetical protein